MRLSLHIARYNLLIYLRIGQKEDAELQKVAVWAGRACTSAKYARHKLSQVAIAKNMIGPHEMNLN